MFRKHFYGKTPIFRVIHLYLTHGEHHHHDFGVYRDIFRQQYSAAFEIRRLLDKFRILLFESLPELIQHHPGKKRFGNKCVNTGLSGFLHNFIPII